MIVLIQFVDALQMTIKTVEGVGGSVVGVVVCVEWGGSWGCGCSWCGVGWGRVGCVFCLFGVAGMGWEWGVGLWV